MTTLRFDAEREMGLAARRGYASEVIVSQDDMTELVGPAIESLLESMKTYIESGRPLTASVVILIATNMWARCNAAVIRPGARCGNAGGVPFLGDDEARDGRWRHGGRAHRDRGWPRAVPAMRAG